MYFSYPSRRLIPSADYSYLDLVLNNRSSPYHAELIYRTHPDLSTHHDYQPFSYNF